MMMLFSQLKMGLYGKKGGGVPEIEQLPAWRLPKTHLSYKHFRSRGTLALFLQSILKTELKMIVHGTDLFMALL